MIKQINDSLVFLDICDKLKYVPDCNLKENRLYNYMISGIYTKKILTFVSYDKKMNGCAVISIGDDIVGDLTLFVVFIWLDPHYRKLWREYMKFVENKARKYKCKKISFATKRSAKAIERQMGKYGYKKVYNIIEKEMKEVV